MCRQVALWHPKRPFNCKARWLPPHAYRVKGFLGVSTRLALVAGPWTAFIQIMAILF